ncbi:hypothetical protein [Acidithiobacillus sp.]|uniref:hypothetical protein n=1 Tax=Acidithiobacillus sp. TaxID=1872118 RepID=UPI00258DAEFD|nr:hypothetical protein [Acidithiobacillus sp.]MDD5375752.1 hypothetical protein [Acidithiobacillus sp.]
MKWALVLLALLLAGCTWFVDDTYDPAFDIPATGATTPYAVCRWVDTHVDYLDDAIHDQLEYWQSPDQTYEWGRGDCEDYALLVLYLIHRDLGGWPELVIGRVPGGCHAWVLYDGRWYEAQTGQDVTDLAEYVQRFTVSYGKAMWRSMNTHRSLLTGERE